MFFPGALLESMYVGRISKEMQCLVTAVSNPTSHVLPQMAVQLQYDKGKWCTEGSFTSDDGLLGIRALYNIGQQPYQWSIGTEAYYGVMDKSGGCELITF
jgi:distribution and morphology protein 10